jgi:hypothetical protein
MATTICFITAVNAPINSSHSEHRLQTTVTQHSVFTIHGRVLWMRIRECVFQRIRCQSLFIHIYDAYYKASVSQQKLQVTGSMMQGSIVYRSEINARVRACTVEPVSCILQLGATSANFSYWTKKVQ